MNLSTKVSRNIRSSALDIASRNLHVNTRNVYDLSYGTPGRHANSGITSTVFGAYGFLGRYFMNELGTFIRLFIHYINFIFLSLFFIIYKLFIKLIFFLLKS